LPARHPQRKILKPTQRARRFGQLPIALSGGLTGTSIGGRGRAQKGGEFGKRGEGGHGKVLERATPLG
jgi:hypothetical protein